MAKRHGRPWVGRCSIALTCLLASGGPVQAAPGDLDPSFGTGGIVVTPLGEADGVTDLALQPDGRIVAGGASLTGFAGPRGVLLRYLPDGTLDPSFGSAGVTIVEPGPGESVVNGVALQPDGRIVAAGYGQADPFGVTPFAVTRHLADGTPDPSFGTNGNVITTLGPVGVASDVVVQPDGRIVIAGRNRDDDETAFFPDHMALLRYLPDGTLDSSFGTGGVVITRIGTDSSAAAVALQADGRLVVAGSAVMGDFDYDFAIARYAADGSLDPSFGQGGIVTTPLEGFDVARGLAVLDDGRVVVAGQTMSESGRVALVRYRPDGSLDPTFGQGGVTVLPGDPASADVTALARQADGRLLVAGFGGIPGVTAFFDFNLWRFLPDGELDRTFGADGVVPQRFGANGGIPATVALQQNGRILAAGFNSESGFPTELTVVRYLNARCTEAGRPRLELRALATAPGDDSLRLTGTITVPRAPAIDPVANGMTVTYGDAAGVIVDASLPGGVWTPATRQGWRANGRRKRYTWRGAGPLTRVVLRGHRRIAGLYLVTVVGKRGRFGPGRAIAMPLWATVALVRPFAGTEQCAEWAFPACTAAPDGDGVECR